MPLMTLSSVRFEEAASASRYKEEKIPVYAWPIVHCPLEPATGCNGKIFFVVGGIGAGQLHVGWWIYPESWSPLEGHPYDEPSNHLLKGYCPVCGVSVTVTQRTVNAVVRRAEIWVREKSTQEHSKATSSE